MAGTQPNNDGLGWGKIQRFLQSAQRFMDNMPGMLRMAAYGEIITQLVSSKQHQAADDGSYYITRSPTVDTGLATAGTTLVQTYTYQYPFLIVTNNHPVGGKSIYLDYIKLRCTAAGTAGTSLNYVTVLDTIPRFSGSNGIGGAGTGLTAILAGPYPVSTMTPPQSAALIYAGTSEAKAASLAARVLCSGQLRAVIPYVNDTYMFNFAGCDMMLDAVARGTGAIGQMSVTHPPVCIGPQGSFLLHLWLPAQSAASSYELEVGHIER
jgi:hypothetical protein